MNPQRISLITTLHEMGGDIAVENLREEGGEPVADLVARGSRLTGADVPAERAPSTIGGCPLLAVAAPLPTGPPVMTRSEEARVGQEGVGPCVSRGLPQQEKKKKYN